jgi:hypothetical protein
MPRVYFVRVLPIAAVFAVPISCSKSPAAAPSQESLARAASVRLLGVDLPADSTKVRHSSETLMTHVEDIQFESSEDGFKRFWAESPKLSGALPVGKLPAFTSSPTEVLDADWPASGGTQFCRIEARREPEGSVAVTIRTTHEANR